MPPTLPPTLQPGDRVAVLSPSWCAPAHFPALHEQAMERIASLLGLEPVEFPTTRWQGTPRERAADLMAAFADPSIRAIFATIGGHDQLTVVPHLDPAVVVSDPKPFFGYSDNTNLLNWLWRLGVAAWHGGSTQVHLGPGPQPDAEHLIGLRAALFGGGDLQITPAAASCDYGPPWDDPRSLIDRAPRESVASEWSWSGPATVATGPTWGGNLEVLQWILAVGRDVLDVAAYQGCVLLLETSEEHPPPAEVYRMMRTLGERGLLGAAAAILVARPAACERADDPGPAGRRAYRAAVAEQVSQAVQEYAAGVPVVLGVDFGHTSPQWVLPYGGSMTVDGANRALVAHYGPPRPRVVSKCG